jgi:hypothetical protein
MVRGRRGLQTRQILTALVVLLAMAIRGVLPDGYMLSPSAERWSWPAFTICSGHGPFTTLDHQAGSPDGAHHGDAPDKNRAPLCAFAGLGSIAPPPAAALVPVAFDIPISAARRPIPDAAPRLGVAAQPQSARGPPQSV